MALPCLFALALAAGCGGGGGDADAVGIAAQCTVTDECPTFESDAGDTQLQCLTQFSGGYCSIQGCTTSADCPQPSICVAHTDGNNYCFRTCDVKADCNRNRDGDNEANCSANFDWATPSEDDGAKACVPPSSGV